MRLIFFDVICLIHLLFNSRKGKSRSATALAAYLMKYHDFDNKNSIEFIKKVGFFKKQKIDFLKNKNSFAIFTV